MCDGTRLGGGRPDQGRPCGRSAVRVVDDRQPAVSSPTIKPKRRTDEAISVVPRRPRTSHQRRRDQVLPRVPRARRPGQWPCSCTRFGMICRKAPRCSNRRASDRPRGWMPAWTLERARSSRAWRQRLASNPDDDPLPHRFPFRVLRWPRVRPGEQLRVDDLRIGPAASAAERASQVPRAGAGLQHRA